MSDYDKPVEQSKIVRLYYMSVLMLLGAWLLHSSGYVHSLTQNMSTRLGFDISPAVTLIKICLLAAGISLPAFLTFFLFKQQKKDRAKPND